MDKYGIQDKHSGSGKFVYFADPGSGAFLTPGFGMDEKSGSGSGIRNEKPGSYFLQLKNLNSLIHCSGSSLTVLGIPDVYPGSDLLPIRISDPGSKRFRILDPDWHQRIYVFSPQKIVSMLSEI
jgi:hypothetical protein